MRDFRKIEAWPLADDLAVAVYEATKAFPKEELYGITSQDAEGGNVGGGKHRGRCSAG